MEGVTAEDLDRSGPAVLFYTTYFPDLQVRPARRQAVRDAAINLRLEEAKASAASDLGIGPLSALPEDIMETKEIPVVRQY